MNLDPFSPEMRMGCPVLPERGEHGGLSGGFWPLSSRLHGLRGESGSGAGTREELRNDKAQIGSRWKGA